jgi:hypothetical protein
MELRPLLVQYWSPGPVFRRTSRRPVGTGSVVMPSNGTLDTESVDPALLETRSPPTTHRGDESPDGQPDLVARVEQLQRIAAALALVASTAQWEANNGRLPPYGKRTNMPLVLKQLSVSLTALRALGGPTIDAAQSLVARPPLFEDQAISQVLSGLDEVDHALETEASST